MVIPNQGTADLQNLMTLGAGEIAATLTAIEKFMLQCIHPADCIAFSKGADGPDAKRVANVLRLASEITHWVEREILRHDQVERRGTSLKLFVAVADVSREAARLVSMRSQAYSFERRNVGEEATLQQPPRS